MARGVLFRRGSRAGPRQQPTRWPTEEPVSAVQLAGYKVTVPGDYPRHDKGCVMTWSALHWLKTLIVTGPLKHFLLLAALNRLRSLWWLPLPFSLSRTAEPSRLSFTVGSSIRNCLRLLRLPLRALILGEVHSRASGTDTNLEKKHQWWC